MENGNEKIYLRHKPKVTYIMVFVCLFALGTEASVMNLGQNDEHDTQDLFQELENQIDCTECFFTGVLT